MLMSFDEIFGVGDRQAEGNDGVWLRRHQAGLWGSSQDRIVSESNNFVTMRQSEELPITSDISLKMQTFGRFRSRKLFRQSRRGISNQEAQQPLHRRDAPNRITHYVLKYKNNIDPRVRSRRG